jgi:hypothetical protein
MTVIVSSGFHHLFEGIYGHCTLAKESIFGQVGSL